ncbi:PREDICTED: ninja-family protein AFP2-like [Camelina sativa]|uniref:Ninja-family protein n=1 Tax=Camelina sativa TaxID=90675 RepID=A0ABM0WUL3_CAMSA|nr:PREDICTED: ninja-family protein AFP2-like [Camelina sativa]
MGEASRQQQRACNGELTVTTNLSLDINKYPRDLLRGFMSENGVGSGGTGETDCDDEAAIELNLGLSLGGRFGVDKTPRKLKRSSSVIGTLPFDDDSTATTVTGMEEAEPENYTVGLVRTTSLPAEMEEEWRKRKEMQSLRRMEAKRRRCEKQSFRVGNSDDQTVSFENERWVTASKSGFLQRHLVSSNRQLCVDSDGGGGGGGGVTGGGSSSSLSELDNKNQQGSSNSCNDERSPKVVGGCSSNSGSNGTEKPNSVTRVNKVNENENEKGEDSVDRKGKGMMANSTTGLFDMPCVFTKGDGPNGRRVDGILYKYGKGEEVRIMCICHGSFLTPAEFVKHGGGGDVDRPLRHIVVNTSSSTF